MDKIQRTFEAKTLEHRKDGGRILITTPSVDRDKDRVLPEGVNTESYMRNPVVQWGHSYNEPWQTVGRTTRIEVTDKGITADFELRPAANESDPQNIVRLLWEGGWIKAASIGFIPNASAPNKEGGHDFTASELLEWSLVPIPANQTALAVPGKLFSKSLVERAMRAGGVVMKSPDYRLPDESPEACSARKLPELMDANPGMTEDEARAMAAEICAQDAPAEAEAEAEASAEASASDETDKDGKAGKADGDVLGVIERIAALLDELRAMANPPPAPAEADEPEDEAASKGVSGKTIRQQVTAKRGRVLSSANEKELRAAYESIGRVLSNLDSAIEAESEAKAARGVGAEKLLGDPVVVVNAQTGNGLVEPTDELKSELLALLEVMKGMRL